MKRKLPAPLVAAVLSAIVLTGCSETLQLAEHQDEYQDKYRAEHPEEMALFESYLEALFHSESDLAELTAYIKQGSGEVVLGTDPPRRCLAEETNNMRSEGVSSESTIELQVTNQGERVIGQFLLPSGESVGRGLVIFASGILVQLQPNAVCDEILSGS